MNAPAPDAADGLFDLPPGEFVPTRDELVARLRATGDRELAAAVKALRRPTLAAWAVNRVVREHPRAWSTLAQAGHAARQAQRRALSGIRDERLRAATADRRAAIDAVLELAVQALVEVDAAPDGHVDAIAATFEAASADPDTAEAVATGRLSAPVDAATDFGDLAGMLALSVAADGDHGRDDDASAPDEAHRAAATRRTAIRELAEARQRLEAANRTATARRARADELTATATRAGRRADTLRATADRAVAAADRAAEDAATAESTRIDAVGRAEEASARVDRAAAAVTAARTALDDLA